MPKSCFTHMLDCAVPELLTEANDREEGEGKVEEKAANTFS